MQTTGSRSRDLPGSDAIHLRGMYSLSGSPAHGERGRGGGAVQRVTRRGQEATDGLSPADFSHGTRHGCHPGKVPRGGAAECTGGLPSGWGLEGRPLGQRRAIQRMGGLGVRRGGGIVCGDASWWAPYDLLRRKVPGMFRAARNPILGIGRLPIHALPFLELQGDVVKCGLPQFLLAADKRLGFTRGYRMYVGAAFRKRILDFRRG